ADLAQTWGIPVGEVPYALALSQDRKMVFVITISSPTGSGTSPNSTFGGTPDKWYKIFDGVITDQGTVDPTSLVHFAGNAAHWGTQSEAASFENNYRWMWLTVGYGSRTVGVWHIDDDGVFRLDGATSAATLDLCPPLSSAYAQYMVTPTRVN